MGICTVSWEQHTIAQTRELECTKIVLPEVISRGRYTEGIILVHRAMYLGLNVVEVAHDIQHSVTRYITDSLGLINSYDTWHGALCGYWSKNCIKSSSPAGTKNVDKLMKKITEGRVRDRDVTWFPQLVDKSECAHVLYMHTHYGKYCCREEYQGAPILGNEELWRLSGPASLPH